VDLVCLLTALRTSCLPLFKPMSSKTSLLSLVKLARLLLTLASSLSFNAPSTQDSFSIAFSFLCLDLSKTNSISSYRLDATMRQMPEVVNGDDKSGSTAVCVLISPTHVYIANCGDSRAVLCRRGLPAVCTLDHKPTVPAEKKRIQDAGGSVMIHRVNGSLAVSRALGDFEYKSVEGRGINFCLLYFRTAQIGLVYNGYFYLSEVVMKRTLNFVACDSFSKQFSLISKLTGLSCFLNFIFALCTILFLLM